MRALRCTAGLLVLWMICVVAFYPRPALGHEVRPALLKITELSHGQYEVLWKRPSLADRVLRLRPHLSGGLLDGQPVERRHTPEFEVTTWKIQRTDGGLEGKSLTIQGLENTITDVLVDITVDGQSLRHVLRPHDPPLILKFSDDSLSLPAYLKMGIAHILMGIDHLAFVLGLVLLIRNRIALVKAVTAFTAAHSLTLSGSIIGVISVHSAFIEILVALSIYFLAVELIRTQRGYPGITSQRPWLIAFFMGLIHGAAFAGALQDIGFSSNSIAWPLTLFNAGVEIGQLLFIAVVLLGWKLMKRADTKLSRLQWFPAYVIGSFAIFLFFERVSVVITRGPF